MSDLASRLLLQLKDYGKCNDELAVSVKKTILEPFQVDLNRPESARKPPTTSKFKQMATQLAPIAMRIVNQNIDGLLNLKRTIKETGRYTIAVNCLLDTSFYALTALRHMNTYTALKPLDIEKATSNLICKMVELGEYQRAIDELRKFRVLLAGIAKVQLNPKSTVIVIDNRQRRGVLTESNCCVSQPKTTSDIPESMIQSQWEQDMLKDCQDLFQFPLDTSINDRTMMLLVLAYQMNTIRSWCEIKEGSLVKYVPYFLERPGSFLDWCKHLLQLDSTTAKKQLDTLYKLLYKATNRLPVSEESAFHSYHLQIFSLKALLLAGSTSLQSIMDRLVVIGTTYEKATQQVSYQYIQQCCHEFLELIQPNIEKLAVMDSYFVLCEYYAYISRKAKSYKGAFYAYKFMIRPIRHLLESEHENYYYSAYAANAKLALGAVQMDKIVLDSHLADISTTLNESIGCLRMVSHAVSVQSNYDNHSEQALYNLSKSINTFVQSAKRLHQHMEKTAVDKSSQWHALSIYLIQVLQQCSETLPANFSLAKQLPAKRAVTESDMVMTCVDIMILLSRLQFDVHQPESYPTAYEYLSTAEQMCIEKKCTDGYRWLSGAYYTIGTAIIKTEDYGAAIYPLRKSSSLLEKDLTRASTEEGRLQLCKRYEILGLCCHKHKDYEDAIKAYRLALKRVPLLTIKQFIRQAESTAISTIIEKEILIPKLMDRFLRALVVDPDMAQVHFATEYMLSSGLSVLEQAALYECELKVWYALSLKMNVYRYQMILVNKLLQIYQSSEHPIRRARVLLSQVRIERSKPSDSPSSNSQTALACAEEAQELLKIQDYGQDTNLLSYRRYYMALSMSWIVICERELGQPSSNSFLFSLEQWSMMLKNITPVYYDTPSTRQDIQEVFEEIDDVDQFYDHVRMLADLFAVMGEPVYRIRALRILLQLNNGLRDVQVDHISDSVTYICTIAKILCELGYTGKASIEFNHAKKLVSNHTCSQLANIFYRVHYAQYLTYIDDFETSKEMLDEARTIWQETPAIHSKDALATVKSYTSRCMLLADVYTAHSMMMVDSLDRAIDAATAALSLLNKCIKVVQKSDQDRQPSTSHQLENPFVPAQNQPKEVVYRESQWILAQKMSQLLQRLAQLYMDKGSWHEAHYFVKQGPLLAEKVRSNALLFESCLCTSAYYLKYGDLDKSQQALEEAAELQLTGGYHGLEEVRMKLWMANLALANAFPDIALDAYEEAEELLNPLLLPAYISNLEQMVGAKKVLDEDSMDLSTCLPLEKIKGMILLKKAIVLFEKGQSKAALDLLEKTEESGAVMADEIEFSACLSRFKLAVTHQALEPELGKFYHESTVLPAMKTQAARGTMMKKPAANQELLVVRDNLTSILERMLDARSVAWAREPTPVIQFLSNASGFSMFLKNQLYSQSRALATNYALLEAYYTSMANGVHMRREMQHSIRVKINPSCLTLPSDTEWPLSEEERDQQQQHTRLPRWLQAHLNTLVELYREENDLNDKEFQDKFINILPPHWTVCSLTMDVDRKDLYIAQLRSHEEPFVAKVPLNRTTYRKDNTYPTVMQYEEAASELKDIIEASDDTIHSGANCIEPAQVEAWWKTRKDLDQRLKVLLDTVEDQWLSGFRGLLAGRCQEHKEELRKYQKALVDTVFRAVHQATGTKKQIEFSLPFCRMVLRLGQQPAVRDLEDIVWFMLSCYEAQDALVDSSTFNFKKLMDDIRLLGSRYHEKSNMAGINTTKNIPNDHLILILDKHLQMLPLESMPLLRSQSVSRLPCLSFLRDRILYARAHHGRTAFDDFGAIITDQWSDLSISQKNAYYVLNPGGDLKDTQREFESFFKSIPSWDGVIQKKPLELQLKEALQTRDLYMYFGHSAGQAFMRGTTVRQLPTCAVSLLMGCSSGLIETQGEFDPYGYVLNYLLGGSPAVVANLWDVTDRSIDRLTKHMLSSWGMLKSTSQNKSIVQAVAESRSKCKLSYLIGAAPVVYGIPVYLEPYSTQ